MSSQNTSATRPQTTSVEQPVDILVIGGGVNGAGIARDAVGRGLSVMLCEMNDLASATSSASTKLFHGGLRYLEYFEFGLVRHALIEREILLKSMPHISWPMRFVLPIDPNLKFPEGGSTFGKILNKTMPFLDGKRPQWLTRLGLFMYDNLGGREILPATKTLDLTTHKTGEALKGDLKTAFEYSDCWVQDSRIVSLCARDAAERGAIIQTQTKVVSAIRHADHWEVTAQHQITGETQTIFAKTIVNAGGPWVEDILKGKLAQKSPHGVRLVRGSHIVTKKLFDHDQPYFFQLQDGRIIFAIPYENDFTLIGTTDQDHGPADIKPECTDEERDYIINAANEYLKVPVTKEDVVWTYSGVRPLYDDGASDATSATRDYVLRLNQDEGKAPLLNIFGGKITTFRYLAQEVVNMLKGIFPDMGDDWTAASALPGGDFPHDGVEDLIQQLRSTYSFLSEKWALRLVRLYGTDAKNILGDATKPADLGYDFGATLTQREVDWLMTKEFATQAEDILWRRTKLGLLLSAEQQDRLHTYMTQAPAK